jgi:hypothetical protein
MKYKLPTKQTKAALKRITFNKSGHFIDQYEVDAVFGGAYSLPNGHYIPVLVPDFVGGLSFVVGLGPVKDLNFVLKFADDMTRSHADKFYHHEAAWRLRYDIHEILNSGKAGMVALPHIGVSSFTVNKEENGTAHLYRIANSVARNPNWPAQRSEIPPEIDVQFDGCVEKFAHVIESEYLDVQLRWLAPHSSRPARRQKPADRVKSCN